MTHATGATLASVRRITARIRVQLRPRPRRKNRSVVRCNWCGTQLPGDTPVDARTCSEICARRV